MGDPPGSRTRVSETRILPAQADVSAPRPTRGAAQLMQGRGLWLGHEQISTTNVYLHADMTNKQQAIDRTKPFAAKPGRYQPRDALLAFLEDL